MRMLVFKDLAERIVNDCKNREQCRLPSIRRIAAHYGVAYRTAWCAVHFLKQQNPARFAASFPPDSLPGSPPARQRGDAARGLAAQIRAVLGKGDLQAGVPLPKFEYFVVTNRVAPSTVAAAFRILARSGHAFREKGRWFAGRRALPTGSMERGNPVENHPVILLAYRNPYTSTIAYNISHLSPFLFSMRSEAARLGIHLSIVFREKPEEASPLTPGGSDEVKQFIERLGAQYLGAIVIELDPEPELFPGWVRTLSASGRTPVVYFDSADIRKDFTRDSLHLHRKYFRFFFDEESAMRIALNHCHQCGHRVLGFPIYNDPGYDWAARRREMTMAVARKEYPEMRIECSELSEPFWDFQRVEINVIHFVTFTRRIEQYAREKASSRQAATVRSLQRFLIERTPSIACLINSGITALISMNDRMAYQLYSWCRAAGISVPRQLSLISFDNLPETEGMPFTTIDFGFSRLGYLGLHAILGDIPLPAHRNGNIAGACSLVNRGGVARR